MNFRSLLITTFFFLSLGGDLWAQVCIDARTIGAVASLLQTKKKTPNYEISPQRRPPEQPRVETSVPAYLGDGVYAPEGLEAPKPSDQDRYLASRAGLSDQIFQQRIARQRQSSQVRTAPAKRTSTASRQGSRTTTRVPPQKRKPPSTQSLAQTISSHLGSASCSGICF